MFYRFVCWAWSGRKSQSTSKESGAQAANNIIYFSKQKLMTNANIRTRQELIGNNLMEVVDDYPDQLRVVIDELVSHLDNNQLDQMEDFIVNNYSVE